MEKPQGLDVALRYGLFEAIFSRRSRRFGLGMELTEGRLRHRSRYEPVPLSELEEALLVWAATGTTGMALADLPRSGIAWLFQWTGRSWPCSCNSHSTELFFTNDRGLYVTRLHDALPEAGGVAAFEGKSEAELAEHVVALFRRSLLKLEDGRADMPRGEPGLFDFNAWNVNRPGTTFFVPVTNITIEYMVLLFIYFGSKYGFNIVDELNGGRSCGLEKWIAKGFIKRDVEMSLFDLELRVLTSLNVEQAFMAQNLNLALQALGLGGWMFTGFLPHHILGLEAEQHRGLGFRFHRPEHTVRAKAQPVPVGRDGVFEALCPPYVKDMSEAVDRFLAMRGRFWAEDNPYPYADPARVLEDEYHPSEERIEIVKGFCTYVYETYGRFPAFIDPMFARLAFQAHHLDTEFYDRHYVEGAYGPTHRDHFKLWHPECEGGPPLRRE